MARLALLCASVLVIYWLLPTRTYYWDGVSFAIDIERQHQPLPLLFHPNHLLYTPWGWAVWQAGQSLGLAWRALEALQRTNSLIAAVGVALLGACLRTQGASWPRSVAGAALLAFSATWWRFATDANAYVPSVTLLLALFLLLLRTGARRVWLAGLLHAAAMLFHELAFLFWPVAAWRLWRERGMRAVALYTVAAALPTLLIYTWAHHAVRMHRPETPALLSWVTGHSPDSSFTFSLGRNAATSLVGTMRLFVGGKLSMTEYLPAGAAVAAAVAVAVLLALLLRPDAAPKERPSVPWRQLFLWASLYSAFLLFWLPHNVFYRLFLLPALVLLVAAQVRSTRRLGLGVAAMAVWNLAFFIYPHAQVAAHPPLAFALSLRDAWSASTLVLFDDFTTDDWLQSYWNPATGWRALGGAEPEALETQVRQHVARGGVVWLDKSAADRLSGTPAGLAWLIAHTAEKRALTTRHHDLRVYRLR